MADPRRPPSGLSSDGGEDLSRSLFAAPVPALVCAMVCLAFLRTGILAFFFLVPLAFASGYGVKTAWLAAFSAAAGNGLFSLGLSFMGLQDWGGAFREAAFFFLIAVIFTWIIAPPDILGGRLRRIPGAYRLAGGSVLGLLSFMLVSFGEGAGFSAYLYAQAESISSLYAASLGPDVVQRSLLEGQLSPDAVVELFRSAALRGGALASCAVIFFFSRQTGRALVRLFLRRETGGNALSFRASPRCVWVLSFSLLLLLLSRAADLGFFEIVLWNILILCVMLYLAQGWGILAFLLSRTGAPPALRVILNVLLILLLFRPGINALVLGLITLLGIAENWVPFRAPKTNGPPSTPGA